MIGRALFCSAVAVALAAACSSGPSGSAVAGPADTHCGTNAQAVNLAACASGGADAGVIDYGETRYNAEADDDDCKYHVKFSNSEIHENNDVSFNTVVTKKAGGGAATATPVDLEVFLNDTHPGPNTNQHSTETSAGTYNVGPVRFDAPGRWTVRFHLHEDCSDAAPDSPHGHVAFFIDVP